MLPPVRSTLCCQKPIFRVFHALIRTVVVKTPPVRPCQPFVPCSFQVNGLAIEADAFRSSQFNKNARAVRRFLFALANLFGPLARTRIRTRIRGNHRQNESGAPQSMVPTFALITFASFPLRGPWTKNKEIAKRKPRKSLRKGIINGGRDKVSWGTGKSANRKVG